MDLSISQFTNTMASTLVLKRLEGDAHIARVAELEAASYPSDEAANEAQIRFRQQRAPEFFYAAYTSPAAAPSELVGFVNATLTAAAELHHDTMSDHDPNGRSLCIHSVVIDPAHRRKGLAIQMLKRYVDIVCEEQLQVARILLIAKAYLISFYVKCGFAVTRLSPVAHGQDPWFEMLLDCKQHRRLPVVQVDAFAAAQFQGNPAAVVTMSSGLFHKSAASDWMQKVAMENNLSETAFTAPRAAESSNDSSEVVHWDLKWFTPACEVKLCGHATLSSALVLYSDGKVPKSAAIHFHTLSGVLKVALEKAVDGAELIVMDFPIKPLTSVAAELTTPASIAQGLGIPESSILVLSTTQTTDLLVHIEASAFPSLQPNFQQLKHIDARGIIVTCEAPSASGVDFQSRFFAPRVGVDEDPVTGSAHCALAVYWSQTLNKKVLRAKQATPQRGGELVVELRDDMPGRVLLKGQGAISLRGVLMSAP
ncbi:TPA: hypothetical protein N0F65_012926 [Lagenidium giganteum]|uniref:N-acetyltransferase domain-containing protein n=1 Tax=Lagenidium giganteum TaxID=4803 RepID=A0AAV2Z6X6_9STRA|nr:TPA: hypothetical protein N0F65_012926 [Lagenidium giganteum]